MTDVEAARQIADDIVDGWEGPPERLRDRITTALQAARREGMEAAAQCCNFYGEEARKIGCPHDAGICDAMGTAIRALPVSGDPVDYEAAARFLFDLLDDIDTLDDMAKADDAAYRAAVQKVQRRRFEVATTDGYTVTFLPTPPRPEGETT